MTIFIACFAAALIFGLPTVLAAGACIRSGQLTREEECK